ncbi:MAG: VCBS repeat-containing protein [Saprospiraceae bacterium]|nr:VCBS repeat-containing protein [Saprospiraceae bacterium]
MRTLLFLLLPFGIFAQNPQVLTVFPKNLSSTATPSENIVIQLDAAIDPGSVSSASVRVFGSWSGPATGSFTLENGNTRILFTPDQPFFAGELVTVSINKKLHSPDGAAIKNGYFWQYYIKTAPGSFKQKIVDTIPVSLPSEGPTWFSGAHAGDLNNDGHSDMTVLITSGIRVLLNNGTGQFPGINSSISINAGFWNVYGAGDFDNDGKIDLVASTSYETYILFGDGMGGFSHIDKFISVGDPAMVGDFDFDGDDDILTTQDFGYTLTRLENQGNGIFTDETSISLVYPATALAIADANNDGIADFFLGQSYRLSLYLGDSLGNFHVSSIEYIDNFFGDCNSISIADYNGDGYADAAAAFPADDMSVLILGDGHGGLFDSVILPGSSEIYPQDIDAGDLDGDGDIDIVATCYDASYHSLFRNDGSGGFELVDHLFVFWPYRAVLHDRDGDGDLDITSTGSVESALGEDNSLILFENPGLVNTWEPVENVVKFKLFPNPAEGAVFAEVELKESTTARFDIFDFSGKKITSLQTDVLPEGLSKVLIMNDINDVPMAYSVQLTLANGQRSGEILIR